MSKDRLARLRDRKPKVTPEDIDRSGGKFSGSLSDIVLGSMGRTVSSFGMLSAAKTGTDWSTKTITLVPGVTVSASLPKSMLVEMDASTLMGSLVAASDQAWKALSVMLSDERAYTDPNALKFIGWTDEQIWSVTPAHKFVGKKLGDTVTRADVAVAVVKCLLEAQEWHYSKANKTYRSPVWLFPPVTVTWATMEAMVRDEVEFLESKQIGVKS